MRIAGAVRAGTATGAARPAGRWCGRGLPAMLVVLLALLAPVRPALAQVADGATMTVLQGEVAVIRTDGAAIQPAPSGTTVYAGDEIRTLSAAGALITFFVGTEIELSADTILVVDRVSRQGERVDVSLRQVLGVTINRVQTFSDVGSAYRIEAGGAVALVRGTQFVVGLAAPFAAIACAEGNVAVEIVGCAPGKLLTWQFDPATGRRTTDFTLRDIPAGDLAAALGAVLAAIQPPTEGAGDEDSDDDEGGSDGDDDANDEVASSDAGSAVLDRDPPAADAPSPDLPVERAGDGGAGSVGAPPAAVIPTDPVQLSPEQPPIDGGDAGNSGGCSGGAAAADGPGNSAAAHASAALTAGRERGACTAAAAHARQPGPDDGGSPRADGPPGDPSGPRVDDGGSEQQGGGEEAGDSGSHEGARSEDREADDEQESGTATAPGRRAGGQPRPEPDAPSHDGDKPSGGERGRPTAGDKPGGDMGSNATPARHAAERKSAAEPKDSAGQKDAGERRSAGEQQRAGPGRGSDGRNSSGKP